jgi:O-antigen/teichoic acid export membrane protein
LIGRFARGVSGNLIFTLFNQGSTVAANILLANILGRAVYGRYAIVLGTVQSFSGLAGLGMGYMATRYLSEYREGNRTRAGEIIGLCIATSLLTGALFGLGLYAAAGPIASGALHAPELAPLLRIASVAIALSAVTGNLVGMLVGLERFRELGWSGVAAGLLYMILIVGAGALWELPGAISGLVASGALQCLILVFVIRKAIVAAGLRATFRGFGSERDLFVRWVIPGVLSGLTAIPALWLAQVALTRAAGFGEVARYSAAFNLMAMVLFLPNIVAGVGMSMINSARGERNAGRYRNLFWLNFRVTMVAVLCAAAGMAVVGKPLLSLFGRDFAAGYTALLVLLAATIFEACTYALTQVLQSNERMWLSVIAVNVPRDVTIAGLAFLLAPVYGAVGTAVAYAAGRFVACASVAVLTRRIGLGLLPNDLRRVNVDAAIDLGM